MPKYRITAPDGKSYEINAPEGASESDVLAYAQANYQKPDAWQPKKRSAELLQSQAAEYRDRNPVTNDMGAFGTGVAAFGKSFVDTGQGLAQIYANVADKVAPRPQTMSGLITGQDNSRSAEIQGRIDERRKVDDALMNTPAGIVGNTAGAVTQVLTPGANAAKLVSYGGRGSTVLKGAAAAVPFAASQPVATGETRLGNTAIGAALGGVGAKIAPALQKAGARAAEAIKPEVRALYEAAKARGITLTPAQLSDSRFMKFMASTLQGLPGSGAKGHAAQQSAAFNREVAKEIGSDAPVVTPDVYAKVKALQSKQFETLTSRNDLKVTPDVVKRLEDAVAEADSAGPEVGSAVRSAVQRFYDAAQTGQGGVFVPGKAYHALDSSLGQVTKRGDTTAHFVGNVKNAIREAMDASISPKDKTAGDALRRQYGNRKTIRDLVAKGDGGELSPAALMSRVTANNYGKEAMATGSRGGLGELARIGQRIKEPPSSGTAERMLAAQSLNPLAWPIMAGRVAGGATAGRAANSDFLAQLMMREGRGNVLTGLARLAVKSQPQRVLPAGLLPLM